MAMIIAPVIGALDLSWTPALAEILGDDLGALAEQLESIGCSLEELAFEIRKDVEAVTFTGELAGGPVIIEISPDFWASVELTLEGAQRHIEGHIASIGRLLRTSIQELALG